MNDKNLRWEQMLALLDECRRTMPPGREPESYSWPHEPWKEEDQRRATEQEYAPRVDECFQLFCERGKWPRAAAAANYHAHLRIDYARRLVQLLSTASNSSGTSPVGILTVEPFELVEWLCVTAWHQRHGPPQPEMRLYFGPSGQ